MSEPGSVSIGLIGAGNIGARHAFNLRRHVPAADLVAVCDPLAERCERIAAPGQRVTIHRSPVELIHDDLVDAVIIASPDDTHAGLTLECLRARKPVLCEKPLAAQSGEAAQIVEAECALDRRLVAVGLMRRFDPYHVAVREAVISGRLGRPILYKGTHRNATIPYDSRGEVIISNSAGHDIDAVRWLLGQEIEEVYVRGVRSHPGFTPETTDLLLLQMALTGDCLATVEVFLAAEYGYEVSAEVVAERGSVMTGQPGRAHLRSAGTRSATVPVDWLERFQEAYVTEMSEWVRSVREGTPYRGAGAWDGYMALLVTDACVRSFQTGQPVTLRPPTRPELYNMA